MENVHAAVHLGQDYLENLHSTKNQTQRTIRQLFDVTKKLVTDQTEIQGVSKIDWHTHPWQRTTFLTDKAVQLSTAKEYAFFNSVLCLGRMNPYPESIDAWKIRLNGSHTYNPNGEWDDVAEHTLLNFRESGHPVFRGTSALERGTLKKQRRWTNVFSLLW